MAVTSCGLLSAGYSVHINASIVQLSYLNHLYPHSCSSLEFAPCDGIQIIKLEHEKTTQSQFSITVNGANSLYANVGDTVSIQITVNDTIDSMQEHGANSKLEHECGYKWFKYDNCISYNSMIAMVQIMKLEHEKTTVRCQQLVCKRRRYSFHTDYRK